MPWKSALRVREGYWRVLLGPAALALRLVDTAQQRLCGFEAVLESRPRRVVHTVLSAQLAQEFCISAVGYLET